MNKYLYLLAVLFFSTLNLFSQSSEGGYPISYQNQKYKAAVSIPSFGLQPVKVRSLLDEDNAYGTPYRYGIVESLSVNIKAEGLQTPVDGGTLWRYKLESDSAKSIKLMFSKFYIPKGATLFVYNSDYSTIYGAYTQANVASDSTFAISDFPGNELILEYFEPTDAQFSGKLVLNKVSQAYKDLSSLMTSSSSSTSTEDSLYLDVNCDGGINWQLQKHAICLYSFSEDSSSYLCSGSLINNVNNDGTPYFLTAYHCVSSSVVAQTVVAYFNYETKGCGLAARASSSLSGASLITTGTNSDYTLLEFNSQPKPKSQPYYAGWDLASSATNTVGIHHPHGYKKKISFDYEAPTTYPYEIAWNQGANSPVNTHWLVYFDKGNVGSGSSGSPLFNQNKRIIGQLHGSGTTDSYYGKLNYSWTHYNTGYASLKSYLAGGKDTTFINGYYPATNLPDAAFSSGYSKVCTGAPILFKDYSTFDVSSWKWTVTPSTVTFANNTSDTTQNPVITFNADGVYSVQLIVQNANGADTVTSTITAGSAIELSYTTNPASGICLSAIDSVVVNASGAAQYTWALDDASKAYFNIDTLSSSTEAVIKQTASLDSTFTLSGFYVGTLGTCKDTASFSMQFEKPSNDNIANAELIVLGSNGPFSNACATVESGEPKPLGYSCYSQKYWCSESSTGSVLNNTVWFYFYGPASGAVTIEADSIDGQIALYSADSYQNILANNYTLLAANDDISTSNSNARINSVNVTSGKKYWLQFDGSNGGETGTFYIKMTAANTTVKVPTSDSTNFVDYRIYPNPANNYFTIEGVGLKGLSSVQVSIFNPFGKEVYNKQVTVSNQTITVNFDKDMPDGVYVVNLKGADTGYKTLFIKIK